MHKFYSLILCLLLANSVSAQISPKEHFGFDIGDDYQLSTNTQTEAYFKKLASSDRVDFVEIGKTEEGRSQYMLIVSSPETSLNWLAIKKYLKN
jgi:hypothetical protein